MIGLLTGGLPEHVDVGGVSVRVRTDWRVWVDVWRVIDNATASDEDKAMGILALAFPDDGDKPTPLDVAMGSPNEAIEAAMLFLERKRPGEDSRPQTARERRNAKKHLLDWDYDGSRIAADYQREYSIDLTGADMHWWRFMALFNGLSDKSQIMQAVSTRAADMDEKGLAKEERKALRERKAAYVLPARNREEAAENRRILRGE